MNPTSESALLCVSCARNRWVVDFGFGRLCSSCDDARRVGHGKPRQQSIPVPMPTHQPAPAFNEAAERDDEVPF